MFLDLNYLNCPEAVSGGASRAVLHAPNATAHVKASPPGNGRPQPTPQTITRIVLFLERAAFLFFIAACEQKYGRGGGVP
jgi:hypothetical protein